MERAGEREPEENGKAEDGPGLLGGVTAQHLRRLCEPGWNGGAGYTPEQVGRMTLDQIWFRLIDAKVLEGKESERTERVDPKAVQPDKDGMIRGRAADGTPIKGRIRGKSVARQLIEEAEARKEKEKRKKAKGKRKRKG